MISLTAEYALRAVARLADQPETPLTTQQLATVTQVPRPFLAKVLQSLGRAGVVTSLRGLHGGFMLADSPSNITILDVVNAVDPLRRIGSCPLGLSAHAGSLCPLHRRLDDALGLVETSFRESTVADLISASPKTERSCRFPGLSVPISPATIGPTT